MQIRTGTHPVKTTLHTSRRHSAAATEGGAARWPHLVLDTLEAVEDDGAVAALDVVEAVEGGVETRAAEHRQLHERAPALRGARQLGSLEAVHLAGEGGLARVLSSWGRRRRRRTGGGGDGGGRRRGGEGRGGAWLKWSGLGASWALDL